MTWEINFIRGDIWTWGEPGTPGWSRVFPTLGQARLGLLREIGIEGEFEELDKWVTGELHRRPELELPAQTTPGFPSPYEVDRLRKRIQLAKPSPWNELITSGRTWPISEDPRCRSLGAWGVNT